MFYGRWGCSSSPARWWSSKEVTTKGLFFGLIIWALQCHLALMKIFLCPVFFLCNVIFAILCGLSLVLSSFLCGIHVPLLATLGFNTAGLHTEEQCLPEMSVQYINIWFQRNSVLLYLLNQLWVHKNNYYGDKYDGIILNLHWSFCSVLHVKLLQECNSKARFDLCWFIF